MTVECGNIPSKGQYNVPFMVNRLPKLFFNTVSIVSSCCTISFHLPASLTTTYGLSKIVLDVSGDWKLECHTWGYGYDTRLEEQHGSHGVTLVVLNESVILPNVMKEEESREGSSHFEETLSI